jgi:hypothetical protein
MIGGDPVSGPGKSCDSISYLVGNDLNDLPGLDNPLVLDPIAARILYFDQVQRTSIQHGNEIDRACGRRLADAINVSPVSIPVQNNPALGIE